MGKDHAHDPLDDTIVPEDHVSDVDVEDDDVEDTEFAIVFTPDAGLRRAIKRRVLH